MHCTYQKHLYSTIKLPQVFIFNHQVTSSLRYSKSAVLQYLSILLPSDSLLLQSDLDGVSSWSKKWLLAFNETKLRLLSINTKRSNPLSTADSSYYINGRSIAPCNSHKDLGIVIASDLKWTDHLHLIYIL